MRSAPGRPRCRAGQFARRQLLEPIADDVWYAGEAAHETLWGTVGGAWESGERAADAVLHRLGPVRAGGAGGGGGQADAQTGTRARRAPRAATTKAAPQYYQGTPSIMREER